MANSLPVASDGPNLCCLNASFPQQRGCPVSEEQAKFPVQLSEAFDFVIARVADRGNAVCKVAGNRVFESGQEGQLLPVAADESAVNRVDAGAGHQPDIEGIGHWSESPLVSRFMARELSLLREASCTETS